MKLNNLEQNFNSNIKKTLVQNRALLRHIEYNMMNHGIVVMLCLDR